MVSSSVSEAACGLIRCASGSLFHFASGSMQIGKLAELHTLTIPSAKQAASGLANLLTHRPEGRAALCSPHHAINNADWQIRDKVPSIHSDSSCRFNGAWVSVFLTVIVPESIAFLTLPAIVLRS